jgi:hypothetical protein
VCGGGCINSFSDIGSTVDVEAEWLSSIRRSTVAGSLAGTASPHCGKTKEQGPMLGFFKNIFAKKFSEKIGVFDSKQS